MPDGVGGSQVSGGKNITTRSMLLFCGPEQAQLSLPVSKFTDKWLQMLFS